MEDFQQVDPATSELTVRQIGRLTTLEKESPSCRIVGYRRWDDSHICPIIKLPDGMAELRPNGRLSRDLEAL